VLGGKLLLASFELSSVEVGTGVNVSEDGDSLGHITLHAGNGLGGPFSIGRTGRSGSHLLNLLSEIDLGASGSSTGDHHVESVSGSRGLEGILTRSSTNVDSDTIAQQDKVRYLAKHRKNNFTYVAEPDALRSETTLIPLDKVVLSIQSYNK
jgi:hypothetical protein